MPTGDDLTVFLLRSGEKTTADCLDALDKQSCAFRLEHIRDVAPMSRAFQTMPERCTTPYFVQVDADMILEPHAIETLYEAIRRSGWRTYMVYGRLYEEGFGVGGAVKCWKRSLFRYFRFRDVRTVDRDLFQRTRRLGLRRQDLASVLGIHRPRHSTFSLYLKSKSDVEKWRFLRRPASAFALAALDAAIAAYPAEPHRLLGALLGALTGPARLVRSKDIPYETRKYAEVLRFLGQEEPLAHLPEPTAPETFRAAFLAGYEDYRGRSPAARQALARLVIESFALTPQSPRNLVEILDA